MNTRARKTETRLLPALRDHSVGALVAPGLLAQRRESPRGYRMVALDLAFAAAVRVIHRVHGHTTNRRLFSAPPRPSRLAKGLVLVVQVTHLAHGRLAFHAELAHFARRHLHQRQVAFLAQQLRRRSRGAHGLSAASRVQLQVVHHRSGRNVADLQGIARKNVRALASRNRRAHRKPHRVQDVALVAVRVMQQRNVSAAVRVVFDGRYRCRYAFFVAAEINHAILLLVLATTVPHHYFAAVVASAGALFRFQHFLFRRLLGDLALIEHGHEAPRRRIWIKALESHLCLCLLKRSAPSAAYCHSPVLQILRVLDHLFAFRQLYVGLLPVTPVAFVLPAAAHLAHEIRGAHIRHLDLEDLLHGFLDLRLGRACRHFKHHRVVQFFHAQALFRNNGPANNLIMRGCHDLSLPLLLGCRLFRGGRFFSCGFRGSCFRRGFFFSHWRRSNRFHMRRFRSNIFRIQRAYQAADGFLRNYDAVVAQHIVRLQNIRGAQLHAFEVAAGQFQVAVIAVRHQQGRLRRVQLAERVHQRLGLVRLERPAIHHCQFLLRELGRERRAQRAQQHLLRQRVRITPRARTVHRASMPPQRRADRADARASRALLLPELAARAAHFALFLGLGGASPQAVEIPPRSFMQQVLVDFGAEDRVCQFYLADLLAIQINYIHDRHNFVSFSRAFYRLLQPRLLRTCSTVI